MPSVGTTQPSREIRLSMPFLASDLGQFDQRWAEQGHVVEAVCFDRNDVVDVDRWAAIRNNLRIASQNVAERSLMFHFPVNDSNYVTDPTVRDRLWECIDFLASIDARGLVLHSNQTMTTSHWDSVGVERAKQRYREFFPRLAGRVGSGDFWIALENMPIMGNEGDELDPVLVYPSDFQDLDAPGIAITWDFCHYSYTEWVTGLLFEGTLDERSYYPHIQRTSLQDVWSLGPRIRHVHFSAFDGLALVDRPDKCREGALPWASTLGMTYYSNLLLGVDEFLSNAGSVTFEVAEDDYHRRAAFPTMVDWARSVLSSSTRLVRTD